MLYTPLLTFALVTVGFAQVTAPAGYRKVYMTSNVNTRFVVQPKTPIQAGTTLVVYVFYYLLGVNGLGD